MSTRWGVHNGEMGLVDIGPKGVWADRPPRRYLQRLRTSQRTE